MRSSLKKFTYALIVLSITIIFTLIIAYFLYHYSINYECNSYLSAIEVLEDELKKSDAEIAEYTKKNVLSSIHSLSRQLNFLQKKPESKIISEYTSHLNDTLQEFLHIKNNLEKIVEKKSENLLPDVQKFQQAQINYIHLRLTKKEDLLKKLNALNNNAQSVKTAQDEIKKSIQQLQEKNQKIMAEQKNTPSQQTAQYLTMIQEQLILIDKKIKDAENTLTLDEKSLNALAKQHYTERITKLEKKIHSLQQQLQLSPSEWALFGKNKLKTQIFALRLKALSRNCNLELVEKK